MQVGLVLACALFVHGHGELFRAEPEALATTGIPRPGLAPARRAVLRRGQQRWTLGGGHRSVPLGVQVQLDASDLFALDTTGLEGLEQILRPFLNAAAG